MRVLIEVLHVVGGLIAALVIALLAEWAYPRASDDIWLVACVAMAAVIAMGVGPVRQAYAIDRAGLAPGGRVDE